MKLFWRIAWILFFFAAAHPVGAEVMDSFLARVDDAVVTLSQVYDEIQIRRLEGIRGNLEIQDVRDDLVLQHLYAAEASKMGLEPDRNEVERLLRMALPENPAEDAVEKFRLLRLSRAELTRRASRLAMADRYLKLRKDMTFIAESEIREFLIERPSFTQRYSWEEAREHARQTLVRDKFKAELNKWSEQQAAKGRVQLIELPEGL